MHGIHSKDFLIYYIIYFQADPEPTVEPIQVPTIFPTSAIDPCFIPTCVSIGNF